MLWAVTDVTGGVWLLSSWAHLSLLHMRPVTLFQAWEGSRRPGQAVVFSPWLGFLHAVKNIDWNGWKLIVYLGLKGPPMEKKVVLALPVTWHEENRDTFIPRNHSVLVTENEELWFQSHSQGRIQSKWLSSCSLSPYFQGYVSKCWLLLVESKGSSHVPLPQYCPCLCKSRWVLVARCKNIRMEEK